MGLNPYYTGSYSMRGHVAAKTAEKLGLNPYYTGSYSMSIIAAIAVVIACNSNSLNPYYTGSYSMSGSGTTLHN